MFSFVLPRFFGFAPAAGDRDQPVPRRDRSREAENASVDQSAEREEIPRATTIAGRPATDVLRALGADDVEEARRALSDMYLTYFEALWHFAYRWTRSREQAKELVHDVFLRLWVRRATLDIRGEIVVYLRSAVRKEIYDVAKHTAVVTRMEAAVEGAVAELPGIGRLIDPEAALEEQEIDRIVGKALAGISQRDRDVITMRWIDRMTLDEIASEFGISKSRVRTILARAAARIAPALNGSRTR